jgi:hypothetical protein
MMKHTTSWVISIIVGFAIVSIALFFGSCASTARAEDLKTEVAKQDAANERFDAPRTRLFGIQGDLGAPDGAALGLVVSPGLYWLKLVPSITTNGLGIGWRAGVTLDPVWFAIGPSLTFEYGRYKTLDLSFTGKDLPDLTYEYVNLQGGLEIGSPNVFRFFIHAGPSWVWASTRDLPEWMKRQNVFEGTSTTLDSMSEVKAQAVILPTIKIGVRGMIY